MTLLIHFLSFAVLCLIALILMSHMDPPEDPYE